MEKEGIVDFSKYVEETNEKFLAATPEQKRVMIAEDVIKRVKSEKLVAVTGSVIAGGEVQAFPSTKSLKEIVNSGIACEVCAKGALLCAFVGRVNEFTIGDVDAGFVHATDNKYHTKLGEFISLEQLDLIEIAFEGASYLNIVDDSELALAAYEFYHKYYYQEDCLIAIMENIIENNGTFIP